MLNAAYYPQLRAVLLEIEAFLQAWDPDQAHYRLMQRSLAKLRQDFLSDKIFPAMVVPTLAWKALGREESSALHVLNAAHFLFYAFLDLTDDVEDDELEDPLWHQLGKPIAINAGTSLMFAGLLMLDRLALHKIKTQRIETLRRMFIASGWFLSVGQHRDLASARALSLSAEDVLTTHRLKTGSSVRLYLESAAVLAGAKPVQQQHFAELGKNMGVMVQCIGDWRNLQAPISSDLGNHCQSLPLVLLQERLQPADRETFEAALLGAVRSETAFGANEVMRHLLGRYGIVEPLNQLLTRARNHALEQLEWLRRGGCETQALEKFVKRFAPIA